MREIELEKYLLALKEEFDNEFHNYVKDGDWMAASIRSLLLAYWEMMAERKKNAAAELPIEFIAKDTPVNRNKALQVVYRFLAIKRIESDKIRAKELALEECHARQLDSLVSSLAKQVERDLKKENDSLTIRFRRFWARSIAHRRDLRKQVIDVPGHYEWAHGSMKRLCLLWGLKYAAGARALEATRGKEPGHFWPEAVSSLLQGADTYLKDDPLADYFIKLLDFQDFPRPRTLADLESVVLDPETFRYLGAEEHDDGFKTVINHRIRNLPQATQEDVDRLVHIQEVRLDKKLFLVNGKIPAKELKNFLSFFIRNGKAEKAKKIFEDFKDKILDDPGGFARHYNDGVIDFVHGDFQKSGRKFMKVFARAAPNYLKRDARLYAARTLAELKLQNGGEDPDFFPGTEDGLRVFFSPERQRDLRPEDRKYYKNLLKLLTQYHRVWSLPRADRSRSWQKLQRKATQIADEYLRCWFVDLLERSRAYR